MLKKRSAYRVLARRASGAHVLNGPVMLHRMAKRVFGLRNTTSATPSHRGADAALVAHSSGRRGRASLLQGDPCLPESVWLTIRPERSLAASGKSVRWLSVTPLVTLDHRPAAIRWAARGDHTEGCRGGGRSLPAKPCVPEWPGPTSWSAQYRSASDRRVNWLYSTTYATGAQHAYAAVAEVPVRPCSGGC